MQKSSPQTLTRPLLVGPAYVEALKISQRVGPTIRTSDGRVIRPINASNTAAKVLNAPELAR